MQDYEETASRASQFRKFRMCQFYPIQLSWSVPIFGNHLEALLSVGGPKNLNNGDVAISLAHTGIPLVLLRVPVLGETINQTRTMRYNQSFHSWLLVVPHGPSNYEGPSDRILSVLDVDNSMFIRLDGQNTRAIHFGHVNWVPCLPYPVIWGHSTTNLRTSTATISHIHTFPKLKCHLPVCSTHTNPES